MLMPLYYPRARVISVMPVARKADVWDLTVDQYHNFALSAGTIVHNSKDCSDALAAVCYALSQRSSLQPLPMSRGISMSGDTWMEEQKQAYLGGNLAADENVDANLLPPIISGGDDSGGWDPGGGGGWMPV